MAPKKKKKKAAKGLLSFGDDGEEDTEVHATRKAKPDTGNIARSAEGSVEPISRKLTPNPNSTLPVPKAMTKAALAAEAIQREKLRKEFLEVQEQVKDTEISIPFVFYDGSNIPGGVVKVRKGDHIWLVLERARKVGAEQGVSSSTGTSVQSKDDSNKKWARIGVDDLMLVRGGVIVPPVRPSLVCRSLLTALQHYEIYYFIANQIPDSLSEGKLLFDYKGTVPKKPAAEESLLRVPGNEHLEGRDDDPTYTKVVDKRWYEKNKHIYPASMWKEFKVGKDFEQSLKSRKDAEGNSFFS